MREDISGLGSALPMSISRICHPNVSRSSPDDREAHHVLLDIDGQSNRHNGYQNLSSQYFKGW